MHFKSNTAQIRPIEVVQARAILNLAEASLATGCAQKLIARDVRGDNITTALDAPPQLIERSLVFGLDPRSAVAQNLRKESPVTWAIPQATTCSELHIDATASVADEADHHIYSSAFVRMDGAALTEEARVYVKAILKPCFRYCWRDGREVTVHFVGCDGRLKMRLLAA